MNAVVPLAVRDVATADEMRKVGMALARHLRPGDLVVLSGGLGAGKTTLTQGIGLGLGVRGPITSPTFVIARVHPSMAGGPSLVHVDAYRIGAMREIDDLDLEASLEESITVVEWGEGKVEQLADDRLEIVIEPRSVNGDDRSLAIWAIGARWEDVTLLADASAQ